MKDKTKRTHNTTVTFMTQFVKNQPTKCLRKVIVHVNDVAISRTILCSICSPVCCVKSGGMRGIGMKEGTCTGRWQNQA